MDLASLKKSLIDITYDDKDPEIDFVLDADKLYSIFEKLKLKTKPFIFLYSSDNCISVSVRRPPKRGFQLWFSHPKFIRNIKKLSKLTPYELDWIHPGSAGFVDLFFKKRSGFISHGVNRNYQPKNNKVFLVEKNPLPTRRSRVMSLDGSQWSWSGPR